MELGPLATRLTDLQTLVLANPHWDDLPLKIAGTRMTELVCDENNPILYARAEHDIGLAEKFYGARDNGSVVEVINTRAQLADGLYRDHPRHHLLKQYFG